jgi:hypothetical protein
MGTVSTITTGATLGAQAATSLNAVINALNTIGQYSSLATLAITTTPQAIPFLSNDIQEGSITHSTSTNNTRFIASALGVFNFFLQPQVSHLTTGTGDCTFWLRKNGTTAIANSAVRYRVNGALSTDVLPLVVPVDLLVNDYIEIMCVASANSEYQTTFTAASGSGATEIPGTPSCILTVTQILT